jgi:phage replication O-like protein O
MCANPQKENGFTPIANEILDALTKTKFTELETQALFLILRNTYGYQRKIWEVRRWKVFEDIMHKCNIKDTLIKLSTRKIINLDWQAKTISFQKDYSQWQEPISRKAIHTKVSQLTNFPNTKVSQSANLKVSQVTNKKLVNQLTQVSQVTNSTPSKPTIDNASHDPKENIKERKKDYKESTAKTFLVHSTDKLAENLPIDSSSKTYEAKDASGRYRSPMDHNFGGNGKKPHIKPPDAESNFEFIASQERPNQLILLKQLSEEKKAEFYEWVKGQNKEG